MATSNWLLVLLTTLMGGGSDLLDYVPSQDYWQAKGVTVSVETLLKDLEPPKGGGDISRLLIELGSANAGERDAAAERIKAMGPGVVPQLQAAVKGDDPEVARRARQVMDGIGQSQKAASVRRLIAIRTLGEMKAKEALPALRGLTKSDQMFVADYAKAAVASIEGKAYEREHAASSEDAWLMPENTRLVAHLSTRGGKVIDLDAAMKALPNMGDAVGPGGGGGGAAPDPAAMRKQMVTQFVAIAEKVGNVRLDGLTVGVSGDVGPNVGSVVLVVRGQYDAAAVADLIANLKEGMKADARVIGGATVFRPNEEASFFFPSDTRAVLVGGPRGVALPVEEMVTAARTNAGKLKGAEEMAKLVKSVDTNQPLWGVARMTDAYKRAPVFAPFDTITLVGKPGGGEKGDKIDFRFEGKGGDADGVRQAVNQVNGGLNMAREQLKKAPEMMPPGMKPMLDIARDLMESIKCTSDGKDATLTGSIRDNGPSILMMFMMVGVRAEVEVDPGAGAGGAGGAVREEVIKGVPVPPEE